MENQQLFNIVVVVAGFLAGWVLNNISRSLSRIDEELRDLPHVYVAKDDYRNDIAEVKNILKQIFDKLDNKADKA